MPIAYTEDIFIIVISDRYGSMDFYGADSSTLQSIKVSQIANKEIAIPTHFYTLTLGK